MNIEEKSIKQDKLLCQMESFSHDGNCNRPAKYIWRPKDGGGDVMVCNICMCSVFVNGGNLVEIGKE
jgi:hypothetical protein